MKRFLNCMANMLLIVLFWNIEFGCKYISNLIEIIHSDIEFITAFKILFSKGRFYKIPMHQSLCRTLYPRFALFTPVSVVLGTSNSRTVRKLEMCPRIFGWFVGGSEPASISFCLSSLRSIFSSSQACDGSSIKLSLKNVIEGSIGTGRWTCIRYYMKSGRPNSSTFFTWTLRDEDLHSACSGILSMVQ